MMMDEDISDLLKNGNYQDIINHLSQEVNLDTNRKRFMLITAFIRSGQLDDALDTTNRLITKYPTDITFHNKLRVYKSHILERMSKYDDAFDVLKSLSDVENTEINILKKIISGNIKFACGDYETATTIYEEAIELAFDQESAEWRIRILINLANIYVIQGKYDIAEVYYHNALSINDEFDDIYYSGYILSGMADLHTKLDQFEQAEEELRQCLEIRKKIGNPLELAYCLLQMVILRTSSGTSSKEVEPLINQLQKIKAETNNYRVELFASFGLALYKKSKGTLDAISETEKILYDIVQFKEYSFSISIQAVYHLFDIRLVEYRFNRNPDILISIISTVKSIVADLKEQSILPRERIKLLLLLAQSYRTLGEFDVAITYLDNGLEIAEKHNFNNYISRLHAVKDYIKHLNSDEHKINIDGDSLVDLTSYLHLLTKQRDTDKLVIHDIKNLLHINQNYLELIEDQSGVKSVLQDTIEEIISLIDMISQNSSHILQGDLHYKRIDLVNLIRNRINLMYSSRSSETTEIRFEHPSRPIFFKISRMDIIRITDNLLINAIDYGEKGSEITINLITNENQVVLSIENMCDPIPFEIQDRLFEPSTRWIDNKLERSSNRGLGLSSIKTIINTLNGNIELFSPIPRKQRGVRITINLPYS